MMSATAINKMLVLKQKRIDFWERYHVLKRHWNLDDILDYKTILG